MTIISHKYKFIFLKTVKTAGSSIHIYLARYCDQNDIITEFPDRIGHSEDKKRLESYGVTPRNYIHSISVPWYKYSLKDFIRLLVKGATPRKQTLILHQHSSAVEVKNFVGNKIWENYFKFSFVRNPWDRAISHYYWYIRKPERSKDLNSFIFKKNRLDYSYIYRVNGKIAVDFIGKYENLAEDFKFICNKINIPYEGWLPQTKRNYRYDKRHYSEVLSERQAEFIRQSCSFEINTFGYTYFT